MSMISETGIMIMTTIKESMSIIGVGTMTTSMMTEESTAMKEEEGIEDIKGLP
jgi:hypothetical protein